MPENNECICGVPYDKHGQSCESRTVAAPKTLQRSKVRSTEWMDARQEAIHEISGELQKLAEVGKWQCDEKWDLREYFKMKKLAG